MRVQIQVSSGPLPAGNPNVLLDELYAFLRDLDRDDLVVQEPDLFEADILGPGQSSVVVEVDDEDSFSQLVQELTTWQQTDGVKLRITSDSGHKVELPPTITRDPGHR